MFNYFRLLILFVGLSLILGLSIWLVTSLYRLYLQVSFTAPLLANLLLLLLIILIGLLIAGFIYYFNFYNSKGYRKKSRKRSVSRRVRVPEDKTEAAAQNLRAIGQQVGQIQDKIAREAF